MKIEKKVTFGIAVISVVLFVAVGARADWDLGDGHKMHYPQLPDPNGWDVDVTRTFVADDWQCSQSGPVDDIHFWISAEQDYTGNGIDFIDVTIYDDIPAVEGDPTSFSHPGEEVKWSSRVEDQAVTGDVFTIRQPALQGNQGWYTPDLDPAGGGGYHTLNDHTSFWQVNIKDIVDPFVQTEGNIYWLEIHIIPNNTSGGEQPFFGWKTSQDHWHDDAVYQDADGNWHELFDPRPDHQGVSLDMAFVITPEPITMVVLALGLLPILLLRRHRKMIG